MAATSSASEEPRPETADLPDEADDTLGAGIDFANPNSPLAPFYAQSAHVVAVVVLGALFVLISWVPMWHTDVWGHLCFGEYIVKNHRLPTREMFSGNYADQDAEYINYQWIAQAGAYWLFDLGERLAGPTPDARLGGGVTMLTTAHAAIVALRALLLIIALRRLTGSLRAGVFGATVVLASSLYHLYIMRPQVLGELAFAALLIPLSRPVLSRRALVLVPLLFALWANVHGSFPVGLLLLGLFLAGQALTPLPDEAPGWRTALLRPFRLLSRWREDVQFRRLAVVLIVSVAAVAVLNPHGPALLKHIVQLSRHPSIATFEEWKPIPWRNIPGYIFLGMLLALAAVLTASPRQPTATQMLLLLVFGGETIRHVRFLVWWMMVFAWLALPHLMAVLQHYRIPTLEDRDRPDLRKTILTGAVAVCLLLWSAPAQWFFFNEAPSGATRVHPMTPLKPVAYLKRQYEKNPNLSREVWASETQGEYLLWELHRLNPPVRVSCYTHVHLLREEHWRRCMIVKNGDEGWQDILDEDRVAFLVFEPELHLNLAKEVRAATDRWEVVPNMAPQLVAKRKPIPSRE